MWSGTNKLTNRNKGDKGDKEKDKAEWQLVLDFQEKKLLEGVIEACNLMSDNLKYFLRVELNEIKKINDIKKDLKDVTPKNQHLESKSEMTDKVVQSLKEQNKEMQVSITTLECKALDNSIRLRGVVEEKGEDIRELISGLFTEYLEE